MEVEVILRGSIDLVFKPLTVPSNWGSASIWGSRFSAIHYAGRTKPAAQRLRALADLEVLVGLVQYWEVSDIGSVGQMVDLV